MLGEATYCLENEKRMRKPNGHSGLPALWVNIRSLIENNSVDRKENIALLVLILFLTTRNFKHSEWKTWVNRLDLDEMSGLVTSCEPTIDIAFKISILGFPLQKWPLEPILNQPTPKSFSEIL